MKKKLLFVLVTVLTFALFAPNAFAAVKNEEDLKKAIADGDTIIELSADIELTSGITIDRDITITGGTNKYQISSETVKKLFTIDAAENVIKVKFENLKMKADKVVAGRCIDVRDGNIELTLNGVELTSTTSGTNTQKDRPLNLGGNSTGETDVVLNIKDSTLTSGNSGYGFMAYNPVNLTIDNSSITGYGAIYMKAPDGSKGTAGSVITIKNNSKVISNIIYKTEGDNDFGAIVLEDDNIKVTIENSTIETNSTDTAKATPFVTQEDTKTLVTQNEFNVTGNSKIVVNAEIYETLQNTNISIGNNKVTIEQGTESSLPIEEDQVSEGKEVYETVNSEGEIEYIVATEEDVTEKVQTYPFESVKEFEEMLKNIEENEYVPTDIKEVYKELEKKIENKNIAMAYEIYYESYIGENYIVDSNKSELENAVEVILEIPEGLEELQQGFTRKYTVVRLHYNFNDDKYEIDELEAKDNGDGTVSFESDKFSTYVLTYEDVKEVNEELPPKTGDINLIMLIVGIIIAIGGIVVSTKKRLENNI